LVEINNKKLKLAENLKDNWKFKKAFKLLDDYDVKTLKTAPERIQYYFLKSSILFNLTSSKDALRYIELAYNESQKLNSDYDLIDILLLKAHILSSMNRSNESLENIIKAEKILLAINQPLSEEVETKKGYVLLRKGSCYFSLGDISLSLRYLGEALTIAKKINDKKLGMLTAKWLAINYSIKGEIDHASEYREKYLELAIELEDKQEMIGGYNSLGMAYTEKGEFKQAIEYLEKGLKLCYEINSWKTFVVYTSLFDAYLQSNSLEKAQQCQDQMKLLVEQGTFKFNKSFYRLQEAALLKKNPQESSQNKAAKIFKEFADKETAFIEMKYYALVNLCDLYLARLKETNNLKELDKIQPYIDKIWSIAEKEEVYSLLVEINLLQAKLKLVVFEFKEAQELLTQSLNIANKYGQTLLARRVENEQAELSKNFLKWEKLKTSREKISERMDLARIDEQIEILLQKRNYLKSINSD
jgi:tetratricopeptide (TPR) repeat protein